MADSGLRIANGEGQLPLTNYFSLTTRRGNAKLQDVGEEYLYLTTTGRTTGKARGIEI